MNLCALHEDALTCIFAQFPAEFRPILRQVCRKFRNDIPHDIKISIEQFMGFMIRQKYMNILRWYLRYPITFENGYKISYIIATQGDIELLKFANKYGCKFNSYLFNIVASRAKIDMMDFMWNIGCIINMKVWDYAIDSENTLVFEWLYDHGFCIPYSIFIRASASMRALMSNIDPELNNMFQYVRPISGYYT